MTFSLVATMTCTTLSGLAGTGSAVSAFLCGDSGADKVSLQMFALAMMSLALASLSVACLYCTWAMNYGILLCIARIVGLNLLVQVRKLMIGSNRDTTASRPTSQIIRLFF